MIRLTEKSRNSLDSEDRGSALRSQSLHSGPELVCTCLGHVHTCSYTPAHPRTHTHTHTHTHTQRPSERPTRDPSSLRPARRVGTVERAGLVSSPHTSQVNQGLRSGFFLWGPRRGHGARAAGGRESCLAGGGTVKGSPSRRREQQRSTADCISLFVCLLAISFS